jgi:basic membrane protein A
MKQLQRKWWSGLALFVAVALVLTACAPAATSAPPTPQVIRETVEVPVEVTKQVEVVVEVTPTPAPVKIPRVAIIFSGKAQDQSFNQFMYDDAQEMAAAGEIEVSFAEDVAVADFERVAGDFASQGYDLIIGHTSDYADAGKKVAELYPDTHFAVTSSITFAPNLAGVNTWTHQSSAVAGYLAAQLSKTKQVGIVGAFAFPTQFVAHEGFKFGVFKANQEFLAADRTAQQVSCLETFTNSWTDTALGYEAAKAQMDQGADFLYLTASGAGVGVIQAAQETKKALVIGAFTDLNPFAPEVVVTSVERNAKAPLEALLTDIKNGNFQGKDYGFDLTNGGTVLSPYHNFDSLIPQEVKDKVAAFQQKIVNGVGAFRVPFVTAKLGGETGCEAPIPPAPTATP